MYSNKIKKCFFKKKFHSTYQKANGLLVETEKDLENLREDDSEANSLSNSDYLDEVKINFQKKIKNDVILAERRFYVGFQPG